MCISHLLAQQGLSTAAVLFEQEPPHLDASMPHPASVLSQKYAALIMLIIAVS